MKKPSYLRVLLEEEKDWCKFMGYIFAFFPPFCLVTLLGIPVTAYFEYQRQLKEYSNFFVEVL